MKESPIVTRDRILEGVLLSYAQDPQIAQSLVFQGGGALHFIYGSPRYSTDLDFVHATGAVPEATLLERLKQGAVIEGSTIVPNVKVAPGETIRMIRATYRMPSDITGKVEIAQIPSSSERVSVGKYAPLRVETPREIYADKVFATMARMDARGSLKPSDLFDLVYLARNFGIFPGWEEISQIKLLLLDFLEVRKFDLKLNAPTGNRTRVSTATGSCTNHYTIEAQTKTGMDLFKSYRTYKRDQVYKITKAREK